ncbi:hypothetical protein M8J75_006529 [Diaphorina citri]|nr:hypothetical protein M8J75_006529 [Diaphorina citri]
MFSFHRSAAAHVTFHNSGGKLSAQAALQPRAHLPNLIQAVQMAYLIIEKIDDFKQTIRGRNPVLAYFFKPSCGFCKQLEPKISTVSETTSGVEFVKINVENGGGEIAREFEVQAVPTVIGFRNGDPVDMVVGNADQDVIQTLVSKLSQK